MPRLVLDILSSHDCRSSDTFLSLFPTWVSWSVVNGLLLINQTVATSMTISRMTRMAIPHGEGCSRLKSSGTFWRSIEVSLTAHNLQPRLLGGVVREHIGSNATRKRECHRPLFANSAFHSTASDAPTISFASPLLL